MAVRLGLCSLYSYECVLNFFFNNGLRMCLFYSAKFYGNVTPVSYLSLLDYNGFPLRG